MKLKIKVFISLARNCSVWALSAVLEDLNSMSWNLYKAVYNVPNTYKGIWHPLLTSKCTCIIWQADKDKHTHLNKLRKKETKIVIHTHNSRTQNLTFGAYWPLSLILFGKLKVKLSLSQNTKCLGSQNGSAVKDTSHQIQRPELQYSVATLLENQVVLWCTCACMAQEHTKLILKKQTALKEAFVLVLSTLKKWHKWF